MFEQILKALFFTYTYLRPIFLIKKVFQRHVHMDKEICKKNWCITEALMSARSPIINIVIKELADVTNQSLIPKNYPFWPSGQCSTI